MKSNYSLWFVPEEGIYEKFSEIITRLSGEYAAPLFEPHVTLAGPITALKEEIVTKVASYVANITPFSIHLTKIDYEPYFFRAVYIKAEETKELVSANQIAKEKFDLLDEPYMPHLSLLYGDFSDTTKMGIIESIGEDFSCEFLVRSVSLVDIGEDTTDVKNWKLIKNFLFKYF